uniref:Uncharacterized protein n=1 Tax=Arundo donax TaxID=35708 RepID=A0A0A8Y2W8_ARUDO
MLMPKTTSLTRKTEQSGYRRDQGSCRHSWLKLSTYICFS